MFVLRNHAPGTGPIHKAEAGIFRSSHLRRMAMLAATGGVLLQLAGCASGLSPVLVSFAESAVLSFLLGYIV